MPSRERPIRQTDTLRRPARDANQAKDVIERSLHRAHTHSPLNQDDRHGALTATDYPRLGLFQIPVEGTWEPGSEPDDPSGWAYMDNCKWVWYDREGQTYETPEDPLPERLWHTTVYPADPIGPDHGGELRTLHEATGLLPARYGPEDFVWAYFNQESGRWEIWGLYEDHWRFELIDDIQLGGSGTAYLRLAEQGIPNPGAGNWITTDYFFTVHDSQEFGPFRAGQWGIAKRYGDSNRWEILFCQQDATEIVMLEIFSDVSSSGAQGTCNALRPNSEAPCHIYYFDQRTGQCNYDVFNNGIAHDRINSNFLLAGERAMGVLRRCGTVWHVDVLGSHGLFRWVKASARIECDGTGNAKVLGVDSSATLPLSSSGGSTSGQATCVGEETNCTLNICNAMGYSRPIKADEEVPVRYVGNIWVVIPTPYPTNAEGVLLENLCPDEQGVGGSGDGVSSSGVSVNMGEFRVTDYCGYSPQASSSGIEAPETYNNKYKLCGEVGDIVRLYYNKDDDEWVIEQIIHKFRTVVTDHREVTEGNRVCIELGYQLICVPACDDDKEWEELLCGRPCTDSSSGSSS